MAVYDPSRKRNARGEQRQQELLRAAAVVFAERGYHETTTNAIAAEAGVSPATLYQFFPNKEAIASALTESYARQMAEAERGIDAAGALGFEAAVTELLRLVMTFNRERPEFHTLVLNAPLSDAAKEQKQALSEAFVEFIGTRLRRVRPGLSEAEAAHHSGIAFLIFRGILDELTHAKANERVRLEQAMLDAVLRYLRPVVFAES